ncbi:hypothetical protein SGPA1_40117 [Streptomyces misionensis JCM 4497]
MQSDVPARPRRAFPRLSAKALPKRSPPCARNPAPLSPGRGPLARARGVCSACWPRSGWSSSR